jgi:acyl-coenzyme A synthetase/AMP-(fatty) acid ligase
MIKIQEVLQVLADGPQKPDRPFLLEGLTREELYARAWAVADCFLQAGCARTTPVCLCVEDRGWMAAAMLASLAGGPPLLFPYAFSESTLSQAHQNIAYTHALADEDQPLPDGVERIPLPELSADSAYRQRHPAMQPDATWIYLFTGGSTGTPRIWSKTPRNLLLESANLAKFFNIHTEDVILASVPAHHIYGLLYSVLLPLVSGACVSARTPLYPNEIIQTAIAAEATVLVSIPAHYRAMQPAPLVNGKIHTAFSSAGALPEQDDLEFHRTTGIAITEIYGSTETGGIAFRRRGTGLAKLQPFAYVDVKLEGERLFVRSDFLSAELPKNQEGYFLAADRAAPVHPHGFEILGRTDGIIKVGGKRVDLSEVRQAILSLADIDEVYVTSLPVRSGRGNEIIAVLTGRISGDRMMRELKSILPPYSLPRRVKVVDQIPLSATGKINRDAIMNMLSSGSGKQTVED